MRRMQRLGVGVLSVGLLLALAAPPTGCTPDQILHNTEEISGDVTVQFINNTPFRAAFSFGSYNSLDRSPPGEPSFEQLRVEGNTTSQAVTVTCRRTVVVGTEEFIERVLLTEADEDAADFDADAFSENVNFSSADPNSASAALPTVGTARGREALAGLDFRCGDRLIFIFEQDAAAPGGFRVDLQVIPTDADD